MKKRIDITGRTFGSLIVLGFNRLGEKRGKRREAFWKCLCSCGTECEAEIDSLKCRKKSCGCLSGGRTGKKRDPGIADLNAIYANYRQRAKSKNMDFAISKEMFRNMTSTPCNYCGSAPTVRLDNQYASTKCVGRYPCTGLDRIDSSKGYTPDNVVSCCITCNRAKNDMDLLEFENWMSQVSSFRPSVRANG